MKELILPILMITICIILLIAMAVIMKKNSSREVIRDKEREDNLKKTAQDFVNVKDIKDIFLYTRDNYLISYIKVQPISFELLTKSEQRLLAKKLTEEFSLESEPFQFLAVSRPVDITPLVEEYTELLSSSSNPMQKEILRNEIKVISDFSLSGEVVQREFYYILWEKDGEYAESDLKKRVKDLAERIDAAGIKSDILKEHEIIKLCNLVNNPAFVAIEDTNTEVTIPLFNMNQ